MDMLKKTNDSFVHEDDLLQIYNQWHNFINCHELDKSGQPSKVILDSWRRCRKYCINPKAKTVRQIIEGSQLDHLLQRNACLINISKPFMKTLHDYVKGSDFSVALFDNEGYMLHIIGDEHIMKDHIKGGYITGSNWSEKSMGTNGCGTPLVEDKPLQVVASEHFCKLCHPYTGSGAPIHDTNGAIIGAIVMTAFYDRVNPHTLGMVVAAAHAIENEIQLLNTMKDLKNAYDFQHAIFESSSEASIVINSQKKVMIVNETAKRTFGLSDRIYGVTLRDIFSEDENRIFINRLHRDSPMIDRECTVYRDNEYKKFTVNTTQVISSTNEHLGKIITMKEMAKTRNLVTQTIGAKANFHFRDMVGEDPKFLSTIELGKRAAATTSNVLLLGDSGTGKDIFAQAIHNESSRKNNPYIAVNSGALPRELILSELFGYADGAFTGSKKGGNPGKFELAHGGTIFLDEIGEMPLESQIALLRVIEEKRVTRIGAKISTPLDVRIIAATNKNLREEVSKGNFREDLYYRLDVFTIEMIPLRERTGDIPLLLKAFIRRLNSSLHVNIERVDEAVIKIFMNYTWPGNIRELQNVIERMINIAPGSALTPDLLPRDIVSSRSHSHIKPYMSLEEMERLKILELLQSGKTKSEVARQLKIARSTLYLKMNKYKLSNFL